MKDLFEVISLAAFIALCAGLYFIFHGEPSLFQVWHAQAMGACKP